MFSTESLEQRLLKAENPREFNEWYKQDSYYTTQCRISSEDVPELLQIVQYWNDPDWPYPSDEPGIAADRHFLMPVTAWRSLAEFRSEVAVAGLIDLLLVASNDTDDDWVSNDLPQAFAKIGLPALAALAQVARNESNVERARMIAVESIEAIMTQDKSTRAEVSDVLVNLMETADQNTYALNGLLAACLTDNRITEAAEAIERAFAADLIDVGFTGDWEMTRTELGVAGLGLEMPKSPHNSLPSFDPAETEFNGPASSMFRHGMSLGYDMTTKEGFSAYVREYVNTWIQEAHDQTSFNDDDCVPGNTIRIVDERIGRNDPCPCGSGKKFKKCCNN